MAIDVVASVMIEVEGPGAGNDYRGRLEPFPFGTAVMAVRGPVFKLGEVLRLDHNDRDQFGRKPDKWDVGLELFEDAAAAFDRAFEVVELADA